jgi:hypothetical protein
MPVHMCMNYLMDIILKRMIFLYYSKKDMAHAPQNTLSLQLLPKNLTFLYTRPWGIYAMNEEIVTGANHILEKYHLPYLPMIHCFLANDSYRIDLTEGNKNGKNRSIEEFLFTLKVIPNISEKDEYLLYKTALKNHILNRKEMERIKMMDVLRARADGISLLRSKVSLKYQ